MNIAFVKGGAPFGRVPLLRPYFSAGLPYNSPVS